MCRDCPNMGLVHVCPISGRGCRTDGPGYLGSRAGSRLGGPGGSGPPPPGLPGSESGHCQSPTAHLGSRTVCMHRWPRPPPHIWARQNQGTCCGPHKIQWWIRSGTWPGHCILDLPNALATEHGTLSTQASPRNLCLAPKCMLGPQL